MNDLIVKNELIESNVKIENMIYEIRGVRVILDRDLALLYNVETKVLIQSVKRNIKRFPENFMFQLTKEEFLNWRSQFVTSKNDIMGLRRPPYAFTEFGVAMISGVLRSDIAISTSIMIINAFINTRHNILNNGDVYQSLNIINNQLHYQENRINENTNRINNLFLKLDKKEQLLLKGHTYDAYVSVLDILNNAEKEIIIIDNYADIKTLDLIRNINCNVILITRNSNRLSDIEIEKYNNQYHNLKVFRNGDFHDRYFIIDRNEIYLSGTSINNIGNNSSTIIKLEDESVKRVILQNVDNILNEKI